MKKTNALLLAVAAFVVGFGINQAAISDVNQKIGVVDVAAVVSKSAQVQSLKKEQEKKMQELDKWLQTVRADVDKQQTQEGKEKLIKKYDAEFATKKENIAKNYQTKLQAIDTSISNTIANQAKAQGYTLVLSKGIVLYGGDDLTTAVQKVVK